VSIETEDQPFTPEEQRDIERWCWDWPQFPEGLFLNLPAECVSGSPNRTPIPKVTRARVLRRDGYECWVCGTQDADDARLAPHHVHSRHHGGCNHEHNLIALCGSCNSRFGTNPGLWRRTHQQSWAMHVARVDGMVMGA
jgi:hypothetical protein